MKKRVGYFDIAKGIGILLVVIAHIEYMPLEVRQYIVTFHMPAFFVISGMLMNLTREKERPVKPLLVHKLQRILVPYLVFSVIYPLIDLLRYVITGNGTGNETFWRDILVGLSMTGVSVLWFLSTLFFSELIVLAIVKNLKKSLYLLLCIAIVVGVWFLGFAIPPMALMFWRTVFCSILVLLGYLLFPVIAVSAAKPWFLLPISAALFVVLYFTGLANGIVDLHYILLGNKLLYYVNAMMGSMALILLSVFIEAKLGALVSGALEFLGKNSLFIMITHINFFVLYVSEKIAFAITDNISRAKEWIFNISTVLIVLLIETVLIILWEKIKNYGKILFNGIKFSPKKGNVKNGTD